MGTLQHRQYSDGVAAPPRQYVQTNHHSRVSNASSLSAKSAEGISVPISPSNNDPTLRGSSAKSSGEKTSNVIFIARWAQRYTTKEGARVTGMTPNGFRKLRDGQNSISFDKLTLWCRNDKDFAAAYAAHVGLILPGEAEFAGALTKAFNAYERSKGK